MKDCVLVVIKTLPVNHILVHIPKKLRETVKGNALVAVNALGNVRGIFRINICFVFDAKMKSSSRR